MKQKKCKVCDEPFNPSRGLQRVCSPRCALEDVADRREKKERKQIREAKRALKTISDLASEAQAAFNRYIRQRDLHLPCISCGRMHNGQWHAGHYRTTAAAPQLRFDESNVHKQCAPCNNHKSGDIVNYRLNLIARVGQAEVDRIETDSRPARWTRDELIEIKKIYNQKYRGLL